MWKLSYRHELSREYFLNVSYVCVEVAHRSDKKEAPLQWRCFVHCLTGLLGQHAYLGSVEINSNTTHSVADGYFRLQPNTGTMLLSFVQEEKVADALSTEQHAGSQGRNII